MATYETWHPDKPTATRKHQNIGCLGTLYEQLKDYGFRIYYATVPEPKYNGEVKSEGVGARVSEEDVNKHVELLHKAGFIFNVCKTKYVLRGFGEKPVPAYCFEASVKDNSPLMGRFLLNAIRWICWPDECLRAFHLICQKSEMNPKTELDYFNAMILSIQVDQEPDSRNVGGLGYGEAVRPLTQAELDTIKSSVSSTITMFQSIPMQYMGSVKYEPSMLMQEGAYAKYIELLEAGKKQANTDRAKAIQALAAVLDM